ncbi:hypothetical protein Vafri_6885 [Volvox africanus]|uniref:Uncharacterized protein n=1 Tax=Volvox africanus TaxID=51714 RepID=A0A8J4B3B2_9CHLO|nr:hypothetical protein Vafri_6885 [Volvox africanus]
MANALVFRPAHCSLMIRHGKERSSCSYVQIRRFSQKSRATFQQRTRHVIRSTPDEDYYARLFNSPIFRSELVLQEFNKMVQETVSLSQLAAKFPDFDLTGKRMYLDKMDEVSSRYEIFIKRLELSQDPAAKEFLRFTTAQMLEGGLTYSQMFMGLKQSVEQYRQWVEQEERVSNNPVAHQQFLQDFRAMWEASFLGRVDLTYLFEKVDPMVLMKAQADPRYWVAVKEIATDPANMGKWLDDPNLGPFVAALWKSMQDKSK